MDDNTNPAFRLHAILKAALGGNEKERMFEVWARVFEIEKPDGAVVARYLLGLSDAVNEMQALIQSDPGLNPKPYMAGLPAIREAINPLYLQSSRQSIVVSHITPEILARLEFCGEHLRQRHPETLVSKESLAEVARETLKNSPHRVRGG